MADNSTLPVNSGTEVFANKDIAGVKFPKSIPYDSAGAEIVPATAALQGALTETAPASDTASSGHNGRLQRIAQRLTSLIALFPSSIGAKNAAGSLSVTTATDDNTLALFGAVTETAPASDTASSGLNGRLQRIAQRLTSLLPANLTVKAASTAAVAADQALVVAISPNGQNDNGRAAAADSTPTVFSTEDLAEITAIKTSVQLLDDAVVADDAAFTPATTKVHMAGFFVDESSTDSADEGDGGAARMTPDRKQYTVPQPHTLGGFAAPFYSLDLDETEELVKTGAGCLYKIRITNRTTSARYVKLYDGVLAGVTVGSTTPLDTIPVPAGGSADLATVLTESFGGLGLPFTTGLCIAATTGFADNDTGAPGTNDVIVSAYYK